MSLPDTFMMGPTIDDIETLEDLGVQTGDPDADYQKFSVVDTLGDLLEEGNGHEKITWHYTGLLPGDADIFVDFLDGDISAPMVIRSRLNRLNMDKTDYQWGTFETIMSWMHGPEQNPALHTMDATITFIVLSRIPDYP